MRFGSGETWVEREVEGQVDCTNDVFGDPTPGVAKICQVPQGVNPNSEGVDDRPRVFVVTDLANYDDDRHHDEDDIVAIAAFALVANEFDIAGITVGASPDAACQNADRWARNNIGKAYADDLPGLRKLDGYPDKLEFTQSALCTKQFDPKKNYDVDSMPSVKQLVDAAKAGPLLILAWGELGEVAVAMKELERTAPGRLEDVAVVSHWTEPYTDSNCRRDRAACDYLHDEAKAGRMKFYELGPMGQRGLVEDKPCAEGEEMSKSVLESELGALFAQKWGSKDSSPDFSDGATNLVVQGFAGGLEALKPDGRTDSQNDQRMCRDRGKVFRLLEERAANAAAR